MTQQIEQVMSLDDFAQRRAELALEEVGVLRKRLALCEMEECEVRERIAILGGKVVEPKPRPAPEPSEAPKHEGNGHEPEAPPAVRPAPKYPSRAKPPRTAVCHICRGEFPYPKKGKMPKRPECGRKDCRPVSGAFPRSKRE